jgi:hypothetical protein
MGGPSVTGVIVVGGLVLLTVATFTWARISAGRAEGRSIESYGHALGVLGDVARRGEGAGNVRILPREESGRAHVRTERSASEFPSPLPPRPEEPPARRVQVAAPPVIPRISLAAPARPLRFEDDTLPPSHMPRPAGPGAASRDAHWRQVTKRRLATGSAAGIAVLLATVGVLQLTGGGGHAPGTSGGKTKSGHHGRRAAPAQSRARRGGPGPSGAPHRLVPVSATTGDVSFQVPSRTYMLTFSDRGTSDCWVGVETAAGSGIWLWTDTLTPGSTSSYRAAGPVVAVLGAPKNIDLWVNGVAAELPGYAGSYDLSFTTATASA